MTNISWVPVSASKINLAWGIQNTVHLPRGKEANYRLEKNEMIRCLFKKYSQVEKSDTSSVWPPQTLPPNPTPWPPDPPDGQQGALG